MALKPYDVAFIKKGFCGMQLLIEISIVIGFQRLWHFLRRPN